MNPQTLHRPRTAWHALLRGLGWIWQRLKVWNGRRSSRHEGEAVSGFGAETDPATAQRRAREAWTALVRRRAPHLLCAQLLPPIGPRSSARLPASPHDHAADSAGDRSEGAGHHQEPSAQTSRVWPAVRDSQPSVTYPSRLAPRTGSAESAPGSLPGSPREGRAVELALSASGGAESARKLSVPPPAAGPGDGAERTRLGSAGIVNDPSRSHNVTPVAGIYREETAQRTPGNSEKRQLPALALPTWDEAGQITTASEAVAVEEQSRSPEGEVWQHYWYMPQGTSVSAGMPWPGQESEPRTVPFVLDSNPDQVNHCVQMPLSAPPAPVGWPALAGDELLTRNRDPWPGLLPDPRIESSDAGPAILADQDRRQRLLDEQRGW